MPIQRCSIEGKLGWKWGQSGHCYTGPRARAKALRQAQAIRASGWTGNAALEGPSVRRNPLAADPTRTATLRRQFIEELRRRWASISKELMELVAVEDAFGLSPEHQSYLTNVRWRFRTNQAKVEEYERWIQSRMDAKILDASRGTSDAYWDRYVEDGYKRGAGRAFDDVRKAELASSKEQLDFYKGSREEFLRSSFGRPEAVSKVKLLAGRVLTELKGVTQAVATRMSRLLVDGLVTGSNPLTMARTLRKELGYGSQRAEVIARTEIIRAHAEGQLAAMEELGVQQLGVMVEWDTAGDERVCPLCHALAGIVVKTSEAHGMIPRHPNCRCAFVPANVGESTKGQVRGKQAIQGAMDKSITLETPKKLRKLPIAERRAQSSWTAAEQKIASGRPQPKVSPEDRPKLEKAKRAKPLHKLQPELTVPESKPISKSAIPEFIATFDEPAPVEMIDANAPMIGEWRRSLVNRTRDDYDRAVWHFGPGDSRVDTYRKAMLMVEQDYGIKPSMLSAEFDHTLFTKSTRTITKRYANKLKALENRLATDKRINHIHSRLIANLEGDKDLADAAEPYLKRMSSLMDDKAEVKMVIDKKTDAIVALEDALNQGKLSIQDYHSQQSKLVEELVEYQKKQTTFELEILNVREEMREQLGLYERALKVSPDDLPPVKISFTIQGEHVDSQVVKNNVEAAKTFIETNVAKRPIGKESLDVTVDITHGIRAHCATEDLIRISDDDSAATIVHEFGHALDFGDVDTRKASIDFKALTQSRSNTPDVHLKTKYPSWKQLTDDEIGNPDSLNQKLWGEYLAEYVGKSYFSPGHGFYASEVTSMGIEMMYKNAIRFGEMEPEYCKFIIAQLRGLL